MQPSGKVFKRKPPSGFATGNSRPEIADRIAAPQGQGDMRQPPISDLVMKRINADSTRRYLFARDYYDEPFLTSNTYYQNDVLTQHQEMKRKKESLTAQPNDQGFRRPGSRGRTMTHPTRLMWERAWDSPCPSSVKA